MITHQGTSASASGQAPPTRKTSVSSQTGPKGGRGTSIVSQVSLLSDSSANMNFYFDKNRRNLKGILKSLIHLLVRAIYLIQELLHVPRMQQRLLSLLQGRVHHDPPPRTPPLVPSPQKIPPVLPIGSLPKIGQILPITKKETAF